MADAAAPSQAPLSSVPEGQTPSTTTASSTSGLPAAAKAAAEQAVKAAIAENTAEEGEIKEAGQSSSKEGAPATTAGEGSNGIAADGSGMKTVFSDPANFNVVHPLYSKW